MPHIVVIEENELMRDLLVEWLREEGYDVEACKSCARSSARPELVIVDLQAPRDDGTHAMGVVKQAFPHVPIIAMSGSFRPQVAAEGTAARALGARRVIAKPFQRKDMIDAVRAVVGPAR